MLTKYLRLRQLVLSTLLLGFLFISCGANQFKSRITSIDDSNMQLYLERDSLTGEIISVEIVTFENQIDGIKIYAKYTYPEYTKDYLQLVVDNFIKSSIIPEEVLTEDNKKALQIKEPNWESYHQYYCLGYLRKGFDYIVSWFV